MKKIVGFLIYYIGFTKIYFLNHYLSHRYLNQAKKVGKNVKINGVIKLTGLDELEIGENVHIGENAFFRAEGGLVIGDNTHFARNVTIYTHSHNYEGKYLPYDDTFNYKKVTIGNNVWVGINVTILPGSTIGDGAIIGAGSTIVGHIPSMSIYGAAKASKIKSRNELHYKKLESNKKFGGVNGVKYEK